MRNRPSGFTLIELMIAVAIIGILSSVAIPEMRNVQLRSRQAERTIVMTSVQRAVEDHYVRESRYPVDLGGGSSLFVGIDNPNFAPGTFKQKWRVVDWGDHWKLLGLIVEGDVYYSYAVQAVDMPPLRQVWITATGDLDGDGVQDQMQKLYLYQGAALQRWWGPQPCSDCSLEQRFPADGRAF